MRELRVVRVLLVALLAAPVGLSAQQHGTEVAYFHLRPDSAAGRVTLHRGEPYRLEVAPASTRLKVMLAGSTTEAFISGRDTANGVYGLTTFTPGDYIVSIADSVTREAVVHIFHEGGAAQTSAAASEAMFEPEETVFDEEFPGPPGSAVLMGGVAYRVEVSSGGPTLTPGEAVAISPFGATQRMPPLVFQSLGQTAPAAGGQEALIIPTASGEYRVDALSNTLMHVKIIRDPRETARWARVRQSSEGKPTAGLTLRFAWMGALPINGVKRDGNGFDGCLGVIPRGEWLGGAAGGCAVTLSGYRRADQKIWFIGIAPQVVVSPSSAHTELSVVGSVQVGLLGAGSNNDVTVWGLGVQANRPLGRCFQVETEAGGRDVKVNDPTAKTHTSTLAPYVSAGLQWRP